MCPILQSGGLHIIFNNNKMASPSLQVSLPWLKQPNPLCYRTTKLCYNYRLHIIYVIISSDTLEFDYKRDIAFCVGIDELHHPNYAE